MTETETIHYTTDYPSGPKETIILPPLADVRRMKIELDKKEERIKFLLTKIATMNRTISNLRIEAPDLSNKDWLKMIASITKPETCEAYIVQLEARLKQLSPHWQSEKPRD